MEDSVDLPFTGMTTHGYKMIEVVSEASLKEEAAVSVVTLETYTDLIKVQPYATQILLQTSQ